MSRSIGWLCSANGSIAPWCGENGACRANREGTDTTATITSSDPTNALELDQPRLRASLVGSQLVGLAMLRYVVKIEPLASAPPAKVAAWIGPTLQRYLTDAAAIRPEARRG